MNATARAETVGSLLRAEYLRQARQEQREGRLSAEQLRQVEDRAVLESAAQIAAPLPFRTPTCTVAA
jgi:5-methyltetrahydropteroyltriglutamate--homocysteine methyltransferase